MNHENLVPLAPEDVTEVWLKTVLEKSNPDVTTEVISLDAINQADDFWAECSRHL